MNLSAEAIPPDKPPDAARPPLEAEAGVAIGEDQLHGTGEGRDREDVLYAARPVKGRRRATAAEMEERAASLIALADSHGPCSVRHLFYLAVVHEVPGITKDGKGYDKIQRQVLDLRRAGRIGYDQIVDGTRLARSAASWGSAADAVRQVASIYRRNLWDRGGVRPEIWCESDSIAGVILDVAFEWTVPVMSCKGDASESFAWNAAQEWLHDGREPFVFYIGDHDGAGLDIERKLRDKLARFYGGFTFDWKRVGVTHAQAVEGNLPSQPAQPKDRCRGYHLDRKWEAEAMPPGVLRDLVQAELEALVDPHALHTMLVAERSEKQILEEMAAQLGTAS